MISFAAFVICVASFKLAEVESRKSLELEHRTLTQIFENYDKSIRPYGENGTGPVNVEINTFIRSLTNLNDVEMAYDTQLTFRMSWVDSRLKYADIGEDYITLTNPERLWIPDLFFSNEADGHFHHMITPNILIRIYPTGRVLYSTRISLHLFCPMNLKSYPMDTQTCQIMGASYGYTTRDIVFTWKKSDPVQITKNLHLQKFSLYWFKTGYCNSKTNTGEYSCIKINMRFSRSFFYYMERAFMPTAVLVFMSWVVFWIHPRCTNIRLGIWVAVLLSNMIVTTSINDHGPEVSYTKALDVWLGVCATFIFCVLLELCLANNALTKEEMYLDVKTIEDPMSEKNSSKGDSKRVPLRVYSSTPLKWLNKYSTKAQRIDVVSRFLFPALFAFFNFVYWITYAPKGMDD